MRQEYKIILRIPIKTKSPLSIKAANLAEGYEIRDYLRESGVECELYEDCIFGPYEWTTALIGE